MSIITKERSGKQVPPGTHLSVCYRVIDFGTQPDTGFGEKLKVCIFWELPYERITIDGVEKAMGISRFYTNSLGKRASLRKDLESWRGRPFTTEELSGFDLANILGKPCQLQIVDNGEGKSVVSAVVGVPKGTTVPPAMNPLVEFSHSEGRESPKFKLLPDWVKEMMEKCLEWQPEADKAAEPAHDAPAPATDEDSQIPF